MLLIIFSVTVTVFVTVYIQQKTVTGLQQMYNPAGLSTALMQMRGYLKKSYNTGSADSVSINETRELSAVLDSYILRAEEFDMLKRELMFRIIINSLVPFFVIMLIFIFSGRYILKNLFLPISVLTESMKSYSRGDLSVFPMPVSGIPESKMLLTATNSMMETIREQKEIISVQGRSLGWKNSAREIVHEIKNILTPARLAAESSVEGAINNDCSTVKNDVKKVLLSLDTLEKTARSLQQLSSTREPVPERVDLYAVAEETVSLYSGQFGNIKLEGEHYEVICDRELLRSALGHLIVNSIDSVRDLQDGEVIIRTGKREKVFLECSDNGAGIETSVRERVFNPNFTTKADGTGFGLFFVKRILDDHGYTIEIDKGISGEGVTMRMVF